MSSHLPPVPDAVRARAEALMGAHFDRLRAEAITVLGEDLALLVWGRVSEEMRAYREKVKASLHARRDTFDEGSAEFLAFDRYLKDLSVAEARVDGGTPS